MRGRGARIARRWLIPGVAAWCVAALAEGGAVEAGRPELSRFDRTVLSLQTAPPEAQADFVRAALGGLAEIYIAEADLARQEAGRGNGERKLLGWSRAVDRYAGQLLVLLEEVDLGLPVALSVNREGAAAVAVGGRPVMLNHPRPGQQGAFEQRVLEEFCARHDCETLSGAAEDSAPIPVTAATVAPLWAFSERGPICSLEGLSVHFDSAADLPRKRGTCEQLLHEALTLAAEIAWQRRHGVEVAWEQLAIRPTPQRPEHLVQLNRAGDVVLLSAPLINAVPAILGEIRPWLRARSEGVSAQLELEGADFGW
ncbi:MAG: hypothetical protein P8Y92_03490 [Halioglobus sp.]|jgi:hypothetical protein